MARKRQIGTRIDDSGEIAEAWDEYREDFENKSSAMRQLMQRGLEVEQADDSTTGSPTAAEPAGQTNAVESLSVGAAATFIAWLAVTAASVVDLLTVTTGTLVVSGIIVVGFATTVLHLKTSGTDSE
ncbi:hypothetical protein DJ79_06195 [Halorubrum ezzemoulense]|uniref:Uncharacterized protein n=1 Tax=Halorubrum ezzemoulense TaxID=337243 RepID=A0A256JA70_HALEZ|nr:hypothetical protein [Halorubrum ezzemoulense]OYR65650.1 hypothetical protein DJ80_01650 [Halorubrum ezzemoulense]OYR68321.1 hypothetical protein DJ79_06195 [Halorubrum ezzemoulense]